MSVLIETNLGDIVIDLKVKECPNTTKNFLKLCKIKYYNFCIFYNVQKDYLIESGDPSNIGNDGESIYGILYGNEAKYFQDEIKKNQNSHSKIGTVAMANKGKDLNDSRFYITTKENLDILNEKHTVFGQVVEGLDVLEKINTTFVDDNNRPLQNIRILHTIILDDPFPDPNGLEIPDKSPLFNSVKQREQLNQRFEIDDDLDKETRGKSKHEINEAIEEKDAKSRSELLEMIGVLPSADIRPPDHVLFVCKLNPITEADDLEIVFSQCGTVKSCEVVRDKVTGDSLCYAFIEYSTKQECERAYLKMENILIDERRIHVDFCQSVAKVNNKSLRNFLTKGDQKNFKNTNYNDSYSNKNSNKNYNDNNNNNSNKYSTNKNYQSQTGTKGYDYVYDDDDRSSKKLKYQDNNNNNRSSYDRDYKDRYRERDRDRDRERDKDRDREYRDRDYRDSYKERSYDNRENRDNREKYRDNRDNRDHHRDRDYRNSKDHHRDSRDHRERDHKDEKYRR